MSEHIDPMDLPPIWQEVSASPIPAAFAVLIVEIALVFLAMSPALIIAVWRWAL